MRGLPARARREMNSPSNNADYFALLDVGTDGAGRL